ncbi:type I-F CRISPR-associated endoribonuclease Cas6/Csy4 [Ferrimonas balearica]|uniref:type I-F CRISPR-associated endoribonuclease Cas6/Csy4 n=1 Tax=Ferrimonas balearica TaxID=44012 RepID=UPI001F36FC73|nr:type I-F CRISPR-associated endoribonuclease Cas6/Csy4 [Ferrimonas balearica]MBY6094674.1 type I-F CRISPR-associated endoribonuclease Cas6/Csy4 [Ferrimonas balearica]
MEQRYFFAIRYVPKHADAGLLAGRCISILHGFFCRHNIEGIGVSFPGWTESSLGNSIAFVSADATVLGQFRQQSYFEMMVSDQLFERTDVRSVPEGCREVRFKRNQSIAKCFSGERRRRLERARRRAETRGEAFRPSVDDEERQIEPFHSVLMHSKSSGQQYLLHVQKQIELESISQDYCRYGLATNQVHLGTVPELPDGTPLFSDEDMNL